MPDLKSRMRQTLPPLYFEDIATILADRGWKIDRCTQSNPFDGHTNGFVVTDDNGVRCRWESLQQLKLSLL